MKIDLKNYTKYLFYVVLAVCVACIIMFNFVLYPLKYKNEIRVYSAEYNIDTSLVASVICNESSFDENSKSIKGAIGLMQLMPSTAQWLCEKLGEEYDEQKLYSPEFNIKLGTYYLQYLTNKFEDTDTAIVAYNAGEGTVNTWLKNQEYSSDGKTLQKIPYQETSNYLTKVKRTVRFYKDRI